MQQNPWADWADYTLVPPPAWGGPTNAQNGPGHAQPPLPEASQDGLRRPRVCVWPDLFDSSVTEPGWRLVVLSLIRLRPHLDWFVPTAHMDTALATLREIAPHGQSWSASLHIGAIIKNQKQANHAIPLLLQTAANHYLFVDEIDGPIDIDVAMYGPQDESRTGLSCFGFTDGFGHEACLSGAVFAQNHGGDQQIWHQELIDQCRIAGIDVFEKDDSGKEGKNLPCPLSF